MRILFLVTRGNQGGAQTNVLSLAKYAAAHNHEVRIGTGEDGWLVNQAKAEGIKIMLFGGLQRGWSPLMPWRFLLALRRELRVRPADVVHMHSSNALFGALAAKRSSKKSPKIIATVHGLSVLNPGWKGGHVMRFGYTFLMRWLWRLCDRLIFVCQSDLDYVLSRGLIKSRQGEVVANGIVESVQFYGKKQAREKMGLSDFEDRAVVGTVARLDYQKDIGLFLRVVENMRNQPVTFRVVGEGPDYDRLQRDVAVRGLKDQVQIIQQAHDGYKYMTGFDLFLMTSRYEGLPYTLLEAGLAGLPVVSVNVDGVGEVVQDGETGILVQSRAAEDIAAAIKDILADKERLNAMSVAAVERIRQYFSEAQMSESTLDIYQKVLRDEIT